MRCPPEGDGPERPPSLEGTGALARPSPSLHGRMLPSFTTLRRYTEATGTRFIVASAPAGESTPPQLPFRARYAAY